MIAKCGVLVKEHQAEIHERELGKIAPNQVLVKMLACNLCTTDYQQWMGLRKGHGYPIIGGHEGAGIIEETGSNVINLKKGDFVSFGYPYCGDCEPCQAGNTSDCKQVDFDICSEDGYKGYGNMCFATYKIADAKNTIKLDKSIPPEEASFLEPIATVIHGIKKLDIQPGDIVTVVGAGTMGLINAQIAKAFGARVIISGRSDKTLNRVRNMGFEVIDSKNSNPVQKLKDKTDGYGADIAIGAVGTTTAYEQCLQMLKKRRGKFLIFAAGYPQPELHITPNEIHYREIEIIGTMGGNISDFQYAAKLLNHHFIDVSSCLEGITYGLKDINKAYAAAATPNTYRVTVDCQDV